MAKIMLPGATATLDTDDPLHNMILTKMIMDLEENEDGLETVFYTIAKLQVRGIQRGEPVYWGIQMYDLMVSIGLSNDEKISNMLDECYELGRRGKHNPLSFQCLKYVVPPVKKTSSKTKK